MPTHVILGLGRTPIGSVPPLGQRSRDRIRRWCEHVLADMAERAKGDEPEATEPDEPPSADHPNSFFPVEYDFRVYAGHDIDDVVSAMLSTADAIGSHVETSHAGVTFGANPGDPTELVKARWRIAHLEKQVRTLGAVPKLSMSTTGASSPDDDVPNVGVMPDGTRVLVESSYTAAPEPTPTPSEGDVWAEVIAAEPPSPIRDAMIARRRMGIDKYGTPLQRDNGRDVRNDMLDEALDLLAYARCALNSPVEDLARDAIDLLVAEMPA